MKTKLLFFQMLLISSISLGQTVYLKFGPSFSKLNWKNSAINENIYDKGIVGFDVIAGINYLDYKYFNISSNIGFIQKGSLGTTIELTDDQGNDLGLSKAKVILNFLTLNTTFNAKIPVKKFISPYLYAGPRLDYLISYNENAVSIKQFEDAGKLNKLIYGLIVGTGVNFNVQKIQLGVVFDYYINMNYLVNYKSIYGTTNKVSDNTFSLNAQIGYKF